MEEEMEITSRGRRKRSFFRKSVGASEFGDQSNVAPSDFGLSTFCSAQSVEGSEISCRDSEIASGVFSALKEENKQWKELYGEMKTDYEVTKADSQSFLRWIREGDCITDADKQFLNSAPDYNGIFAKFENLKELMLLKAKDQTEVVKASAALKEIVEFKLLEQKTALLEKIDHEKLVDMDECLQSLNMDCDDSGCVMEPVLDSLEDSLVV